jgi:hypothetical protein
MLTRWIRPLSLDIVAGGLAGAAFAAHVTGAHMPAAYWEVLPVAIWVVYTLDHLIDGLRAGPLAANPRHAFHARHARTLASVVVIAGGVTAIRAALYLSPALRVAGMLLGALVLLYLAAVRARFPAWLPREIAVALIYVAGIWLGPLTLFADLGLWTFAALALHAAVALGYLFAYAWFEADVDAADGMASLARTWGREALGRAMSVWTGVLVAAALLAAALASTDLRASSLALAITGAVPWISLRMARVLQPFERYRHAEWALLLLVIPPLLARLN